MFGYVVYKNHGIMMAIGLLFEFLVEPDLSILRSLYNNNQIIRKTSDIINV